MHTLNRSALIVTPKQPFLNWVNAVDPTDSKVTLKQIQEDPSIYLVPECDTADDIADVLLNLYAEIFADQLYGWYVKEETWPQKRSFEMFRRWFDVQHHSMLVDLCEEALIRKEY